MQAIASPQQLSILLAIGEGEACVCHLESMLGWRQAYISQHLMALRKADILKDRREGRYVYYRLRNRSYLDLIVAAAQVAGLAAETVFGFATLESLLLCECPRCSPTVIPVGDLSVKPSV